MNKIDRYIDSIYKNFDSGDEDVEVLKEEMRNHLYEEVKDLKDKGICEKDSIEIAIKNFGEKNSVICEIKDVLNVYGLFWKGVVKFSILTFIVGSLFKAMYLFFKLDFFSYMNFGLNEASNIVFLIGGISLWISSYYYIFNGSRDIYFITFMIIDIVTMLILAWNEKLITCVVIVVHLFIFLAYKVYCTKNNIKL